MNGLDWRNLWDLSVIEREWRDAQLERRRLVREADIAPARVVARACQAAGAILVVAGQWLADEPARTTATA